MFKNTRTLLCVLFVIALFDPIFSARGFGGSRGFGGGRHSYPSSRGGLSGGGHHSYPSSGGLSGTGNRPQSHGYPSGGSLSGSGGSHGYPPSSGMSGSGSRPGSYPTSGYKPNNNYPSPSHTSHTTHIQHNYHYSPPQQIRYVSPAGTHTNYPVYRGTPPTYVYQYKDSGSKYGTLLAGLALLNLGVLGGAVYANSQSHKNYQAKPGEICKFGIRKENGDYEETKIDCQIISSYIYQAEASTTTSSPHLNNTSVVTTVVNTTTINVMNPVVATGGGEVMLANGTLMNVTDNAANTTSDSSSTSITTITTTNTTTVSALEVKGPPIEVTPKMKCYVIKTSPSSNMRKSVDCGLLQAYAQQSLRKNSAVQNIPTFTILTAVLAAFVVY